MGHKILILVLSARRTPWNAMLETSQQTWDSVNHPQTQTLYYCGQSDRLSTPKIFYSRFHDESLEKIAARTIEAFEESLKLDWDWMARPHSSTYVHKGNLVKFCESIPKENVIYGIKTDGPKPFLWGGCHYLISREAIEQIVAHKEKWNLNVMEDGSITQMVNELGITVRGGHSATINLMPNGSFMVLVYGHGENFSFTDFKDIAKAKDHFFFRVKHDPDRTKDLEIMRHLWDNLA